jgi:type I restriction enzyme M protein
LANEKGKITAKAIKSALTGGVPASDEKAIRDYLAAADALKAASSTSASLREEAEQSIVTRLDALPSDPLLSDLAVLRSWAKLKDRETALKKAARDAETELDDLAYKKYPTLSEDEVKALVVDDKWMPTLDEAIHREMERVSQRLAGRLTELAGRYATPLPNLKRTAIALESTVERHLQRMGVSWK